MQARELIEKLSELPADAEIGVVERYWYGTCTCCSGYDYEFEGGVYLEDRGHGKWALRS